MTVSDAQRLRTLEAENGKLKRLLAEQMLDNAFAETINGLYKAEVIHRCGPWKSMDAVIRNTRLGQLVQQQTPPRPIRVTPPDAEAEANHYAALEEKDRCLTKTNQPPGNPGRFRLVQNAPA